MRNSPVKSMRVKNKDGSTSSYTVSMTLEEWEEANRPRLGSVGALAAAVNLMKEGPSVRPYAGLIDLSLIEGVVDLKPYWDPSPRTDQELALADRVRKVLDLMRNKNHAKVIAMYYFEGKTHEEIAIIRGTARATVTQLMARAQKSFRKTIADNQELLGAEYV